MEQKALSIRILIVEDVQSDADLSLIQLKRAGLQCTCRRVETEADLRAALHDFTPNIILSDFSLPQFDGLCALEIAQAVAPDTPFIFVSGTIGEERAVNALHSGAVDYVLKDNLNRLAPAVSRALKDARGRKERQAEQARIARLDRVLRMMSGINALMVRIRDRKELLHETCRLAVAVGGYATATIFLKAPGTAGLQALAWSGADRQVNDSVRAAFLQSDDVQASILGQVAKAGTEFVCNDICTLTAHQSLQAVLTGAGLLSLVMLPILLDKTAMGAVVLTARDVGAVSKEELQMLREVAGNLSFALQYLHKDTTVKFLSYFDPQTGLAKRSLFCERLSRLIDQPAGRRSRYAVAVIDITRLSLINDSLGRRTGDLLLQHVAERFKRRFPENEHIAHFGGGTFALIVDIGSRSLEETTAWAREHGMALFGEPFVIEEREISVGVRSGLAIFPDHAKDAGSLVQNAEAALRNARSSGERQIHYSEQDQAKMLSRLALEQKLRLALERDQFELHYQPKVNVISRRIEGVEALIRWRDPERGLISPAEFLPVLESTGLIVEVGDWVVRRAALDCQEWLRSGHAPVRIAVNISPSQLRLPDFVARFLNTLAGWSSPAAGLDIEITEGILQEELLPEETKLKVLRNAGVRIAIDDFGTGYSSLGRLAKLPIDTLKIDRSFICELPKDYAGRTLVKTVITLARAFRLTTVAEGVETQDQLDFLWQVGCDQSQGFLHSRPLPSHEFTLLLKEGRGQLVRPPESVSDSPTPAAASHRP